MNAFSHSLMFLFLSISPSLLSIWFVSLAISVSQSIQLSLSLHQSIQLKQEHGSTTHKNSNPTWIPKPQFQNNFRDIKYEFNKRLTENKKTKSMNRYVTLSSNLLLLRSTSESGLCFCFEICVCSDWCMEVRLRVWVNLDLRFAALFLACEVNCLSLGVRFLVWKMRVLRG